MSHFSKHFQKAREKNICSQFMSAGENWQDPHERKINVTKEAALKVFFNSSFVFRSCVKRIYWIKMSKLMTMFPATHATLSPSFTHEQDCTNKMSNYIKRRLHSCLSQCLNSAMTVLQHDPNQAQVNMQCTSQLALFFPTIFLLNVSNSNFHLYLPFIQEHSDTPCIASGQGRLWWWKSSNFTLHRQWWTVDLWKKINKYCTGGYDLITMWDRPKQKSCLVEVRAVWQCNVFCNCINTHFLSGWDIQIQLTW